MNCLTARKILITKETLGMDSEVGLAKQHVNSCPECRQMLNQQENFRRLLTSKLPPKPVPASLRESILASIAAERMHKSPPRPFNRKTFITVGIAAVLLLLFIIYPSFPERPIEYATAVQALAQDHIANELREHPLDLQTADSAELERWFGTRVDFSVHIPPLRNADLLGGRLCVVNGERVAYLAFRSTDPEQSGKASVPISMYIAERNVIDLSRMRVIASSGSKRILHGDAKGCNVIMWEERGLIFSMVSDMNEDKLVELVAKS